MQSHLEITRWKQIDLDTASRAYLLKKKGKFNVSNPNSRTKKFGKLELEYSSFAGFIAPAFLVFVGVVIVVAAVIYLDSRVTTPNFSEDEAFEELKYVMQTDGFEAQEIQHDSESRTFVLHKDDGTTWRALCEKTQSGFSCKAYHVTNP